MAVAMVLPLLLLLLLFVCLLTLYHHNVMILRNKEDIIMKRASYMKDALVIEEPSQKLLEFVRELELRKCELRNDLLTKKDKYFPAKKK